MNNDLLTTGNDHPKPGYKQTEVGVIPEDWNVVTIREITSLVTNGFVGKATDHYTDRDDGITYIQGYNVEANSFNFNGIKKVTPEFHRIHQKSCVRKDDLLTIQTGEVGLTTIVPDSLVGSNCHALIISRFKKERAYPWFYAHYFNSPMGRLRLRDLEVGTTMMHINVGELLPWEVPCPPKLEEQRSISQALSDVDALIAGLDKAIAKQRAIKTATMQQLLTGKKRLPEFGEGKGDQQTEVGVIPKDWNVVTIREITSLVTNGFVGKATNHYTDKDDGITYIQGYNVEANSFNFNGIKKVTPEFHRIHQKSCLRKDDLLTIQTGEVGLTTIVPDSLVGANCHALIISRFKKEKAYPWFYAHYFNSPIGRLRLRDLEVGTTMMHINVGELLPWEVPYPPRLEEQRAIATVLSDMDTEIAALETRIAKTQALKQGMMQALLTGRIRLA